MPDKKPLTNKKLSADWLVRGVLTKVGDTVDRFTGRRWIPSSSLAASELVDRLKKLLDHEAKRVPGKGLVVPHNIKLRMQWDKFSEDAEAELKKLEYELLTAVADHINDSLYYTFAPVSLDVKPDYFVEGVKLFASFDDFTDEDSDVALNLTIPAMDVSHLIPTAPTAPAINETYVARFELNDIPKEERLDFIVGGSISVGRTGSNALVIDDPSVSKIHASLSVDPDGGLLVADTGSTNGTFINDVRIAYGKATAVEDGGHVKFGVIDVEFSHVPRPITIDVAESSEEGEDGDQSHGTIEIDGFEFKRGSSPESPESPESMQSPGLTESPESPEETLAAIPIPSQTLRISPVKIDETAKEKPEAVDLKPVGVSGDGSDDEPETKFR